MEIRKQIITRRILLMALTVILAVGMSSAFMPQYAQAAIAKATTPASVIAKAGKNSVKITWKKASSVKGYEIYLKRGSKYKKVKTIKKVSTQSWIQKKLKKNKTYTYKVRSYISSSNKSAFSPIVSVKTGSKKNVKAVKLSKTSVTMDQGTSLTLKATKSPAKKVVSSKIRWTSSNKSVATVSASGKITAVAEGTAIIRAMAHTGVSKTCKVTVNKVVSMTGDIDKYVNKTDKNFAWEMTKTLAYDPEYWDSDSGFRTAGSDAEHRTANYIKSKFKEAGLSSVEKVGVDVDKWQFNGASFTLKSNDPKVNITVDPISYASSGTDEDGVTGEIVYMNHGYEADYEAYYDANNLKGNDRNMKGKIVLIDINQDREYWITPHYQEAHDQGAAGLMSYSSQYTDENGQQRGDKWDSTVQMQDICSMDLKLPCVSISREDGLKIKAGIEKINAANNTPTSNLTVDNVVKPGEGTSYNVMGKIKGTGNTGQQILVAGHYDKYLYGVNDDCAAIGLITSMAKAMNDAGYKPVNDIIFIAHGAEEWGQQGTETDWGVGSWQMITKEHPEWSGTTLGIINFELPARLGTDGKLKGNMLTTEETSAVQNNFVKNSGLMKRMGMSGTIEQKTGSQPMSDAMNYQYKGVPCYEVNAESGSNKPSLSTYHTPYDDTDDYSSTSMQYALRLSGSLAMYIDKTPAIQLDFNQRCDELEATIAEDTTVYTEANIDIDKYTAAIADFRAAGNKYTAKAKALNDQYEAAVAAGKSKTVLEGLMKEGQELNAQGLEAYQYLQDEFLGMSGDGNVYPFHQIVQDNIATLDTVISGLEEDDMDKALGAAWQINGGIEYGAYSFGNNASLEALKTVFCEYVTDNRSYGKKVARVDTYVATHALLTGTNSANYTDEISLYRSERASLLPDLKTYVDQETDAMKEMVKKLAI